MPRIITLLMLCFVFACKNSVESSSSKAAVACGPSSDQECESIDKPVTRPGEHLHGDPVPDTSVPSQALSFDANLIFVNLDSAQEDKMNTAMEVIKKVIATEEFRQKVLNHTYNGRKTYVDNGGFTNAEVYQKILDGAETLQNTKDNEMDLEVELYYLNNTTVGYTYPTSNRIWVNTKFFNRYTAAGVARNLFHEWLHKLGFKHAALYSESRDHSVPYYIGDVMEEIGKQFL